MKYCRPSFLPSFGSMAQGESKEKKKGEGRGKRGKKSPVAAKAISARFSPNWEKKRKKNEREKRGKEGLQ